MIRLISIISLILVTTACKTFIVKGSGVKWSDSNYTDYNLMSDSMCISNQAKTNESSGCYNKSSTQKVTQYGNTYVFKVNKRFIENTFESDKLEEEIKGKFKFKSNDKQMNALIGLASFFSETVKGGINNLERKAKKKYIKNSIGSLFSTASSMLDEGSDDIGIAITPISYVTDSFKKYSLAEVSFVDLRRKKIIGSTIYGYVDFFDSGHGGFNISIPTCYTLTSQWIDGCQLNSKKDITKRVSKSQKMEDTYGKAVFTMSLAKYMPPPSQPIARGIPLNF